MKKNIIITIMLVCMFMTAFSAVKMDVKAGEYEGFVGNEDDRKSEGIDGLDDNDMFFDSLSDYYMDDSDNISKKGINLVSLYKWATGHDKNQDIWNEFKKNLPPEVEDSIIFESVDCYYELINYVENEVDEGKSADGAIKEFAAAKIEELSRMHSLKSTVEDIGEYLLDKGEKVSESVALMVENAKKREKETEEYFSNNPGQKEEIEKKAEQIVERKNDIVNSDTITGEDAVYPEGSYYNPLDYRYFARIGLDEMLANGEIDQEEYDELINSLNGDDTETSDSEELTTEEKEKLEKEAKEWLDNGEISQETYDYLISTL